MKWCRSLFCSLFIRQCAIVYSCLFSIVIIRQCETELTSGRRIFVKLTSMSIVLTAITLCFANVMTSSKFLNCVCVWTCVFVYAITCCWWSMWVWREFLRYCEWGKSCLRIGVPTWFSFMVIVVWMFVYNRQQALFHVLAAYSMYNTEVGYCQGMSQIAALLLMYLNEEVSVIDQCWYLCVDWTTVAMFTWWWW